MYSPKVDFFILCSDGFFFFAPLDGEKSSIRVAIYPLPRCDVPSGRLRNAIGHPFGFR